MHRLFGLARSVRGLSPAAVHAAPRRHGVDHRTIALPSADVAAHRQRPPRMGRRTAQGGAAVRVPDDGGGVPLVGSSMFGTQATRLDDTWHCQSAHAPE